MFASLLTCFTLVMSVDVALTAMLTREPLRQLGLIAVDVDYT